MMHDGLFYETGGPRSLNLRVTVIINMPLMRSRRGLRFLWQQGSEGAAGCAVFLFVTADSDVNIPKVPRQVGASEFPDLIFYHSEPVPHHCQLSRAKTEN